MKQKVKTTKLPNSKETELSNGSIVIEYSNGNKRYYLNNLAHREDGPAIEFANGGKVWYLNGKLHREDGPAIEYAHGDKYWYLNGTSVSQTEFERLMKLKAFW